MNKTLSVNIGGFVFNIEEEAYDTLRKYIDSIASFFKGQESGEEIIGDIEQRIAELFNERLGESRQVVDMEDVNAVIEIMGKPEQYAEADEEAEETMNGKSDSRQRKNNRRIYRDPDDAILGGVASGLSHSLNWDPLALRIIFVLLTLFGLAGIPIYIILWAVIPEAKTTAEKLRMRGEKVNVENISKAVSDSMENVRDSINSNNIRNGADKLLSALGTVVNFIAKLIKTIVGVALIALGAGMIIGFVIVVFGFATGSSAAHHISLPFVRDFIFFNDHMFVLAVIAGVILLVVPTIGALYSGVRLLLNFNPPVKGVGLTLVSLFIFGSILAAIAAVNQGTEYANEEWVDTSVGLENNTDTLYVFCGQDTYWHDQLRPGSMETTEMLKRDDDWTIFAYPQFKVRKSTSQFFSMEIQRRAFGKTHTAAIEHAEEIDYSYYVEGDSLILDPIFKAPYAQRFRDQEVDIVVYVPEGKHVVIDESAARIIWGGSNGFDGLWTRDIPGETFQNQQQHIKCTSCIDSNED